MKSHQEYVLVFALMAACAGCSKKSEDAGATATTETAQEEASLVAASDMENSTSGGGE